MSIFDRFTGRRRWSLDNISLPGPSLYEALRANGALPDEGEVGGVRWAPGALDGVMGHHVGGEDPAARARTMAEAIAALLTEASDERLAAVCATVSSEAPLLGVADALGDELSGRRDSIDAARLATLGEHLARRAGQREVVKLGILLMGLVGGGPAQEELVTTLGAHDEFTLFAAVALSRMAGEAALVALARKVEGWGRIQIVERLAGTSDPAVGEWLLTDGYRNEIMLEYTATICARAGRLAARLADPAVDDAILDGAAPIIEAMINGRGGPAEGIDEWDDAAEGVAAYLARVRDGRGSSKLAHLLATAKLRELLDEPDVDGGGGWAARIAKRVGGWTAARRSELRAVAEEIIARPSWRPLVEAALASEGTLWDADRGARILGIDTYPVHRARVRRAPTDAFAWSRLLESAGEARIGEAVALAEELLPLDAIASGPSDELGLGPGYAAHMALELTIESLGKQWPGVGWPLVRAALRSPTVRARNIAARVLYAWGRARWPAEVAGALEAAIAEEPLDDVRARLEAVRDGADPDELDDGLDDGPDDDLDDDELGDDESD